MIGDTALVKELLVQFVFIPVAKLTRKMVVNTLRNSIQAYVDEEKSLISQNNFTSTAAMKIQHYHYQNSRN